MAAIRDRTVQLKRAYEPPAGRDGFRILVDRIWPRGISKDSARIDLWLKDIAPSTGLRRWFGHGPEKWTEFRERYFRELEKNPELAAELEEQLGRHSVTFVYAAKDEQHNNAVALRDYLEQKSDRSPRKRSR
jgi:uncharacterized protein YeaO (DUF488 family)